MILEKIGLDFEVVPSNAEEIKSDNGNVEELVKKNAELKAEAVAKKQTVMQS